MHLTYFFHHRPYASPYFTVCYFICSPLPINGLIFVRCPSSSCLPLGLHSCPPCGIFNSTTSLLPRRPPLNCFVCRVDLPPGTPCNRKVASTSDKQGAASSRPTTDYVHTDGESCRPVLIDDGRNCAKCHDCQNTTIFDLSGHGVEEFYPCQECFFIERADIVRAGVTFIQQSNLHVRSITAYRSPSSVGGSPHGVRSLRSATAPPRTLSTSSPKSPEGAKGAGAANAAANLSVLSPSAKAPGSSRAGNGKRPRVE